MKIRIRYILILMLWMYAEAMVFNVFHHHIETDIHCYSHSEKHFHPQIHHCTLCDCTFQVASSHPIRFSLHSESQICFEFRLPINYSFKEYRQLSPYLRGPPVA